jgi:hypothetical protein
LFSILLPVSIETSEFDALIALVYNCCVGDSCFLLSPSINENGDLGSRGSSFFKSSVNMAVSTYGMGGGVRLISDIVFGFAKFLKK